MQTYPWRQNLCCNGCNSDLIILTFIGLLHKIACGHCTCDLRIALREKNTLIAHNIDYNTLKNIVTVHEPASAVYLSDCDFSSREYETLCYHAMKVYIYKSRIDIGFLKMLSAKLSTKEISMNNLVDIDVNAFIPNDMQRYQCSMLFVTKNILIGHKPTTEQITLALQLEPSVSILRLHNCQLHIMRMLATIPKNWTELDLVNCSIRDIDCESLYWILINEKYFSTVETLKISIEKLTISVLPKLVKIVLMWKVQYLIFCGNNKFVYQYFIKNVCTINNISLGESVISITYNNNKAIYFFCDFNQTRITSILKDATMYFTTCDSSSLQVENAILYCDFQIYIINNTLQENMHSRRPCDLEDTIMTLVDKNKKFYRNELFVFQHMQLTALHFVGKTVQERYISKYIPILKNTLALKVVNNITSTLLHNDRSKQQVYLNSNLLTMKLAMMLKFPNLKTFKMNNSKLETAISCITPPQELNISIDNNTLPGIAYREPSKRFVKPVIIGVITEHLFFVTLACVLLRRRL